MVWVFTYEQVGGKEWDCGPYGTRDKAETDLGVLEKRAREAGLTNSGRFHPIREVGNDYRLRPLTLEIGDERPAVFSLR